MKETLLNLLPWLRRQGWDYAIGDEVRGNVSTGSAEIPTHYIVKKRKRFDGRRCYALEETDTGNVWGWFGEDGLRPYDQTPIPHPGEIER